MSVRKKIKNESAFANKLIDVSGDPFQNDYTQNHKSISSGFTQVIEIEAKENPLIAYRIAIKRIHTPDTWPKFLSHLNQDKIFQWANQFFEASRSEAELITKRDVH